MRKKHLLIAGISGALAVSLGAFGAHGLKASISAEQLEVFKTGIQYHFYHTLAMLAIIAIAKNSEVKYLTRAFNCFFIGILLFSGSLYLLATADLLGISSFKSTLGPITPIGGLSFIIGWIMIILSGFSGTSDKN